MTLPAKTEPPIEMSGTASLPRECESRPNGRENDGVINKQLRAATMAMVCKSKQNKSIR